MLADGGELCPDAKEPRGCAGLPVFSVIKGAEVADAACVVARIFGGTLLGKGELMRAYTKAATDALAAARTVRQGPEFRHIQGIQTEATRFRCETPSRLPTAARMLECYRCL